LGRAMTTSAQRRTTQLAGRETLPLVRNCPPLERRRMPFGLRGQTIWTLRFSGIVLPPRRRGRSGAERAVPPDRLRAQKRLDVHNLTRAQDAPTRPPLAG